MLYLKREDMTSERIFLTHNAVGIASTKILIFLSHNAYRIKRNVQVTFRVIIYLAIYVTNQ